MKYKDKLIRRFSLATLVLTLLSMGCLPEFDDGTMSRVRKAEIISIVLTPPEAAPGETVTASFLMADERGAIEGNASMWMPVTGDEDDGDGAFFEALNQLDLTMNDLTGSTLEFTVATEKSHWFDENGQAGQMLSLMASLTGDVDPSTPVDKLMSLLSSATENGEAAMAIRTLVVSTREERNLNPIVTKITSGTEESQGTVVNLFTSANEDLHIARVFSASNPLVLTEEEKIYFEATVGDEGELDETINYQSISTGGDFDGLRDKLQPWKVPEYKSLEKGDIDQTDMENVDSRTDPNLHPVWLIVRDDGIPGQLGQSWAEFYVRVVPK